MVLSSCVASVLSFSFNRVQYASYINVLFFRDSTAVVGQDLLFVRFSRSHSHTPHSIGLLCASDRPITDTCT
jgi:hypothetical protein